MAMAKDAKRFRCLSHQEVIRFFITFGGPPGRGHSVEVSAPLTVAVRCWHAAVSIRFRGSAQYVDEQNRERPAKPHETTDITTAALHLALATGNSGCLLPELRGM
jgi:hypothetical protein